MKQILQYIIILTAVLSSDLGQAQLQINTPTPLVVCTNVAGSASCDLTQKNEEILGSLNPSLYTVEYYETYFPPNLILDPENYVLTAMPFQSASVKVYENANPENFATTSLPINKYYSAGNVTALDLTVFQSPNNNFATFDLTAQQSFISTQEGLVYTYYETQTDAESTVNPIFNPENYTNTSNPQTIYVRGDNTISGCTFIINFNLIIREDGIVNIPDINFKNTLLSANPNNNVASNVSPNSTTTPNVYTSIDTNNDGEIQYSEAEKIIYLNIGSSNIVSLEGINAFYNLITLSCQNNNITSIDLSGLPKVKSLFGLDNNLTSLNLSQSKQLETLNCSNNQIIEIDLSQCQNLSFLGISSNELTSLDLSNNNLLQTIDATNNNLTSFDLSNKFFLRTLRIDGNQLTQINLEKLPILYEFRASANNLTGLDLSGIAYQREPSSGLDSNQLNIYLNNNVNLSHVKLKNNYTNSYVSFSSNTNSEIPQYICVDETDHFEWFSTTPDPIINSYCSFTPGGIYNTILGSVYFDSDNDGCGESDFAPYIKININDGTAHGASFSNTEGNYLFFTEAGTFTVTPELENPSFFNVIPTTQEVVFDNNNNNEEFVNFCITPNGVHNDLEVVIAPINPARPGFEATYNIVYRNKGNQVISQDYGLSFMYNQNLMTFVSASVTPDTQMPGAINWSYENLKPFESRSILVTMHINPPTDTQNPVNIDDILTFTSIIMPQAGDENVTDNIYVFNQNVVGAFDPNDITCIEGEVVNPSYIGEELHYVIRFENTGNFYAENVVVTMEIDQERYDISSLKVMNASHTVSAQVRGNMAELFFKQIYLDSGGHGNILLVMRSFTALEEGDSVLSKADIYFDYNYPITTNEAVTVFQITMSIDDPTQNIDLKVYPNPTTDYFNLISDSKILSVELYDISGRLIRTSLVNDFETRQDVTHLNKGVYILKIKTENGEISGKITKN